MSVSLSFSVGLVHLKVAFSVCRSWFSIWLCFAFRIILCAFYCIIQYTKVPLANARLCWIGVLCMNDTQEYNCVEVTLSLFRRYRAAAITHGFTEATIRLITLLRFAEKVLALRQCYTREKFVLIHRQLPYKPYEAQIKRDFSGVGWGSVVGHDNHFAYHDMEQSYELIKWGNSLELLEDNYLGLSTIEIIIVLETY